MKRSLFGLLFVALLTLAPAAHAGGFVGASWLESTVDIEDFDESDSGYKIFGGWHFFKFFGVEGGYYDFGNPSKGSTDVEVTAWNISGKGVLPLGPVKLFGKVGYFLWDADGNFDGSRFSEDDNDIGYGVGVAFVVIGKVEIRAEYELIDLDDADLDVASVGAAWRF
jgi:hypothetical protein